LSTQAKEKAERISQLEKEIVDLTQKAKEEGQELEQVRI